MEELRFAGFVLDLRARRLTRAALDPGIGSRDKKKRPSGPVGFWVTKT